MTVLLPGYEGMTVLLPVITVLRTLLPFITVLRTLLPVITVLRTFLPVNVGMTVLLPVNVGMTVLLPVITVLEVLLPVITGLEVLLPYSGYMGPPAVRGCTWVSSSRGVHRGVIASWCHLPTALGPETDLRDINDSFDQRTVLRNNTVLDSCITVLTVLGIQAALLPVSQHARFLFTGWVSRNVQKVQF